MNTDIILFIVFLAAVLGVGACLGKYMYLVFTNRPVLEKVFGPIERVLYAIGGVKHAEKEEMNWKQYTIALLIFNATGMVFLFLLQMVQGFLPLNPQHLGAPDWHVALNTAISFMTNTNWQAYGGETTMSYLTQMMGLTVHNFLSAATGIAVAIALMRGLTRHETSSLGNFWTDLVRCTVRILFPISLIGAFLLVQQGVIQNLNDYVTVHTLEGAEQTMAMGPVASQEVIKLLGTNGGGFFNANSAHPFENPTAWTNFLEMFLILIIPASLVFTFGHMTKNKKQGYAILAAMTILFVIMLASCYVSEWYGNPSIASLGVSAPTSMEGKEVRFGIGASSLFAVTTTATSCGAVNAMHDSLTPLGGMIPMLQIMLGEAIFGGVGSGFYDMMVYVFVTVFIIGLMVGRTPEYLGKKIEAKEMKMVMAALLISPVGVLLFSGLSCMTDAGLARLANSGPHGLSEILYDFASTYGNNGSAFGGLTANTVYYDLITGAAMLIGRFSFLVPMMAVAGYMAEKKTIPAGPGTFDTTNLIFIILLVCIVLIVGALTFFPALSLGPIAEHILMLQGASF